MKNLKHYGVLGMHWGIRNANSSDSSDHKNYSEIRKKKLRDMTDSELNMVVKRKQLVSQYKKAKLLGKDRRVNRLSNNQIETELKRADIYKKMGLLGIIKIKDIRRMSPEEVDKTLKRLNLEKSYKDLRREDLEASRKTVEYLLSSKDYGAEKIIGAKNFVKRYKNEKENLRREGFNVK